MKAIVYKGLGQVAVEDVEDPRLEQPTDAILRITSSALCGSDLHMYEGRIDVKPGLVLGHEPLGVVEEVGPAVVSVKKGDRVFVPAHVCCGFCSNCVRGYTASCLTVNPGSYGAAYGYAGMGAYRGAQAEFLRVPFADANCLTLPGKPGDEYEDDFVLLSDCFVTGYHATELASVSPGSTVAIFGAGGVGLMAAYSSFLRGAAEVYVVDSIPERLAKAREIGAVSIDFLQGDPVEQIREKHHERLGSLAASVSEKPMMGVMCGIDAVGFQAKDRTDPSRENPMQVIEDLSRLINPTGRLGIAGVYVASDPAARDKEMKRGHMDVPWATFFRKGITIGFGRTNDEKYNLHLRSLIVSGRARPKFIITHHISFREAPAAYDRFDRRVEGFIKVVLDPSRK